MKDQRDKAIGQIITLLAILAAAFFAAMFRLQISSWPTWAHVCLVLAFVGLAYYLTIRASKWFP